MREYEKSLSYHAFSQSPHPSYKHSTYFHVYDELLSKYKGREITFVEIGVLNGGSLFMWRDFFGPQARIIGVDLNPGAQKWREHGFEIYIGSQQDPEFLDHLCHQISGIDVLLDDGGHTYLQQIITTECLLKQINDGGMLIVEDTHTSYMDGFGDKNISFMRYVFQAIHKINSRFGAFIPEQRDKRILSIQIFESIVAFSVDRKRSNEVSEPIWNRKPLPQDEALDFRDEDKTSLGKHKTRIDQIIKTAFTVHEN